MRNTLKEYSDMMVLRLMFCEISNVEKVLETIFQVLVRLKY